jgi:hypothetical protein
MCLLGPSSLRLHIGVSEVDDGVDDAVRVCDTFGDDASGLEVFGRERGGHRWRITLENIHCLNSLVVFSATVIVVAFTAVAVVLSCLASRESSKRSTR